MNQSQNESPHKPLLSAPLRAILFGWAAIAKEYEEMNSEARKALKRDIISLRADLAAMARQSRSNIHNRTHR